MVLRRWSVLAALLLAWAVDQGSAKPKEHLKFENAPPRVEVGGTFDITVVGPAGSTDNVTLRVAPSSQGNGTVAGSVTGLLDGGSRYSTVTFVDVSITRPGLYMLLADAVGAAGVSGAIQAIPSVQCNNQPWDARPTCGDCVSMFNFDCVYCPQLEACLPGGYRGADEQATCREFYLNVCWIRGDFATFIIPGAALILAFFGAGYCVCCQARREDRRKALEDYDARFSLAHRRASAKYGATDADDQSQGHARPAANQDMRRKMEAKYMAGGAAEH